MKASSIVPCLFHTTKDSSPPRTCTQKSFVAPPNFAQSNLPLHLIVKSGQLLKLLQRVCILGFGFILQSVEVWSKLLSFCFHISQSTQEKFYTNSTYLRIFLSLCILRRHGRIFHFASTLTCNHISALHPMKDSLIPQSKIYILFLWNLNLCILTCLLPPFNQIS